MAKADETVQERIDEMKAVTKMAGAMQTELNQITETQEEERGKLLSSPVNTQGSVRAMINAALINTQSAVTSLESAQRDLFPQAKNLYFDTDLVGVPFMIISDPHGEMRPDNFNEGKEHAVQCFRAWLLDPDEMEISGYDAQGIPLIAGYKGPQPRDVEVEISGAYVRNTLEQLPAQVLKGRVWTLDYNEGVRYGVTKTDPGKPARMLRFWKPASIEAQGTF